MEMADSDATGKVTFPKLFERMPEKSGYWIEIFQKEGAKWRAPKRLIGYGTSLTRLHVENPLITSRVNSGGLEITVTLREECPTDIEIVDAATGRRKHFAQLWFRDDRVKTWTVAP